MRLLKTETNYVVAEANNDKELARDLLTALQEAGYDEWDFMVLRERIKSYIRNIKEKRLSL
jgi:hypothetical protein